jgi:hypothetical protein
MGARTAFSATPTGSAGRKLPDRHIRFLGVFNTLARCAGCSAENGPRFAEIRWQIRNNSSISPKSAPC